MTSIGKTRGFITIRLIGVYLCASVVPLFLTGCWSVTPPKHVQDPISVYLADYGNHSSVLLPTPEGVYVEYSFGDWAYAVENHDQVWNALGALLVSFKPAYGRVFTPIEPGEERPSTLRPANRLSRVEVSREKAYRVVAEMDDRYQAGKGPAVFNYDNQAFFVVDRQHYSLFNNCNHMSADIMRKLGCEVRGISLVSNFSVKNPE